MPATRGSQRQLITHDQSYGFNNINGSLFLPCTMFCLGSAQKKTQKKKKKIKWWRKIQNKNSQNCRWRNGIIYLIIFDSYLFGGREEQRHIAIYIGLDYRLDLRVLKKHKREWQIIQFKSKEWNKFNYGLVKKKNKFNYGTSLFSCSIKLMRRKKNIISLKLPNYGQN